MLKHSTVILSCLLAVSCSELKDPVETNLQPELSVHPAGWLQKSSSDFHGLFLRTHNWDLDNCKSCHGENYSGGVASSTCLTCHENSPEDCNVCHGGQDNLTGAPPKDIDDNTTPQARGVGAHTAHLNGAELADGIACSTCHLVPAQFDAPGHVDSDLPAEITFAGLALTDGAQPAYNQSTARCSNSYCHGNWSLSKENSVYPWGYTEAVMSGNNSAISWTANEVSCSACHGLPPPGHISATLSDCGNCHVGIVDSNGEIIDKARHINGQVNLLGFEYPMF